MAVAGGRLQVGLNKTGTPAQVPNDYRAKLMFYMNSICSVIPDMQNEPGFRRLRNYKDYMLTQDEEENLLHFCLSLSPHLLDDQCIFKKEGDNSENEFYELTAAHTRFVAVNRILIAGQQKRVQKLMTYTHCWMHRYYYDPITTITDKHEDKIKAQRPRLAIGQGHVNEEDPEVQRREFERIANERRQQAAEQQRQQRQQGAEDRRQREMDQLRRDNEQMRRELTRVREQMDTKDDSKCSIM